ncbi:hypothetical protein PR048_026330 [Dryococelus australis]|uniref:Uncharacterized protein n=1 Tax=Dryococelus australis TaxID=614101 RepID=A0ABQ9GL03_9NEOP|nr:hypothetical protein PR048_026330 [Dryococelus australis]
MGFVNTKIPGKKEVSLVAVNYSGLFPASVSDCLCGHAKAIPCFTTEGLRRNENDTSASHDQRTDLRQCCTGHSAPPVGRMGPPLFHTWASPQWQVNLHISRFPMYRRWLHVAPLPFAFVSCYLFCTQIVPFSSDAIDKCHWFSDRCDLQLRLQTNNPLFTEATDESLTSGLKASLTADTSDEQDRWSSSSRRQKMAVTSPARISSELAERNFRWTCQSAILPRLARRRDGWRRSLSSSFSILLHPSSNFSLVFSRHFPANKVNYSLLPAVGCSQKRTPLKVPWVHAVRREHSTPGQSIALSGDGTLDMRGNVALIASALLDLKRGKKKSSSVYAVNNRARWRSGNSLDSHSGGPGFDSRSGHPDFGFPRFTEITPGECWDGSLTKRGGYRVIALAIRASETPRLDESKKKRRNMPLPTSAKCLIAKKKKKICLESDPPGINLGLQWRDSTAPTPCPGGSAGFLWDLPFPPLLHSGSAPYSPQSPSSRGDPREDPPTNGVVRHDSRMRDPEWPGEVLNPDRLEPAAFAIRFIDLCRPLASKGFVRLPAGRQCLKALGVAATTHLMHLAVSSLLLSDFSSAQNAEKTALGRRQLPPPPQPKVCRDIVVHFATPTFRTRLNNKEINRKPYSFGLAIFSSTKPLPCVPTRLGCRRWASPDHKKAATAWAMASCHSVSASSFRISVVALVTALINWCHVFGFRPLYTLPTLQAAPQEKVRRGEVRRPRRPMDWVTSSYPLARILCFQEFSRSPAEGRQQNGLDDVLEVAFTVQCSLIKHQRRMFIVGYCNLPPPPQTMMPGVGPVCRCRIHSGYPRSPGRCRTRKRPSLVPRQKPLSPPNTNRRLSSFQLRRSAIPSEADCTVKRCERKPGERRP